MILSIRVRGLGLILRLSPSKEGTNEARWEAETRPFLAELAKNVPEVGIHFSE